MKEESNRGMIKWAPYKSLVEQEVFLKKMRRERSRVEKPLVEPDQVEEINRILCQYHGENVTIRYYEDGEVLSISGIIKYLDNYAKRLRIDSKTIPIPSILSIVSEDQDPLLYEI